MGTTIDKEIEQAILTQKRWADLDNRMRDLIGGSQEYDKKILKFSIENQLRYRGNLVRFIINKEHDYYEELLKYSRDHLMLFPYHLSDFIITGMRITPFQYYRSTMTQILVQEKSYDTLPNFTAADCLRLLNIGRNQYIDIMNELRSANRRFLGIRRNVQSAARDLLPNKPHKDVPIEPWWFVNPGYITEDDMRSMVTPAERSIIDRLFTHDGLSNQILACDLDEAHVRSLYLKGLVYLDVPIYDDDFIVVPPLEGFVMNRVTGDYFETLLYKIFISIDQDTPVKELAKILEIDTQLVKNAVSMYCRLKFAYKKYIYIDIEKCHPSWRDHLKKYQEMGINLRRETKKVALFYDSNLAAFLMMGNLSAKLKNHAVTMFEVGKLSDEWIDSLLDELAKIKTSALEDDGYEARRYYIHALMLRRTIEFIRTDLRLAACLLGSEERESPDGSRRIGLDLIRVESLSALDTESCERFLKKSYQLIISIAPLNQDVKLNAATSLPHLGPGSPIINSLWFRLYIYHITGCGPPSLLLLQGYRLNELPQVFQQHETLIINHWNREPTFVTTKSALNVINEALTHSPLLIQAYPIHPIGGNLVNSEEKVFVPLPLIDSPSPSSSSIAEAGNEGNNDMNLENDPAVIRLGRHLDLKRICGFITLLRSTDSVKKVVEQQESNMMYGSKRRSASTSPSLLDTSQEEAPMSPRADDVQGQNGGPSTSSQVNDEKLTLFDCHLGVPLFDRYLNKHVISRISHSLSGSQSLQELVGLSSVLNDKIGSFVDEFRTNKELESIYTANHGDQHHFFTFPDTEQFRCSIPRPAENLLFIDGKLSVFRANAMKPAN